GRRALYPLAPAERPQPALRGRHGQIRPVAVQKRAGPLGKTTACGPFSVKNTGKGLFCAGYWGGSALSIRHSLPFADLAKAPGLTNRWVKGSVNKPPLRRAKRVRAATAKQGF